MTLFVGVDACRGGWVAVGYRKRARPRGIFLDALAHVETEFPGADVVAVDIPIGLPSDSRRAADVEAKAGLGKRQSSVFYVPPRAALIADTHAEASRISREQTRHGLSQQTYGLRTKIREAESWIATSPVRVVEVHPEVSFAQLMGHPANAPKKTWAGMRERWEALEGAGIALGRLEVAGRNPLVDDVLDAVVAAWTAERVHRGEAARVPEQDEFDAQTGQLMAIWA